MLKQLVRDHIDPSKDLGHSDRHGKKEEEANVQEEQKPEPEPKSLNEGSEPSIRGPVMRNTEGVICEDCK